MRNIFAALVLFFSTSAWAGGEQCFDLFVKVSEAANYLPQFSNPFDKVRFLRETQPEVAEKIIEEILLDLKKAPIISQKVLGGGVTASFLVELEGGLKAVYKPINLERPNMINREVAAFRVSRVFGLDIVPPTIVRKINGVKGSLQLFMESGKPLTKFRDQNLRQIYNDGALYIVENVLPGRRLRVFDWLINNHDRGTNAGNYLVSNIDGFLMGIDHSTSFIGHDKQARKDKVPFYLPEFLNDIWLYEHLKGAKRADLEEAMTHLNSVRIPEFFERYDKLIKDFEAVLNI